MESKGASGRESIMSALKRDDVEAALAALASGGDPDERDADGRTALQQACCLKASGVEQKRMLSALLAAGANLSVKDAKGDSTLRYAVLGCDEEGLKMVWNSLGEDGRKAETSDGLILVGAAGLDVEKTKFLLSVGFDVESIHDVDTRPLHRAVREGRLDCVEVLLAAGADPNSETWFSKRAIDDAAEAGNWEAVALLLEAGAVPNGIPETNATALDHAVMRGADEVAIRLFEAGWPSTWKLSEMLSGACEKDMPKLARKLLNSGADWRVGKMGGLDPLSKAARSGSCGALAALLDAGAESNRLDGKKTAMHHAALASRHEALRLLLDRGGDPNARCDSGTIMSMAVLNGSEACVLELLKRGVVPSDSDVSLSRSIGRDGWERIWEGGLAMGRLRESQTESSSPTRRSKV